MVTPTLDNIVNVSATITPNVTQQRFGGVLILTSTNGPEISSVNFRPLGPEASNYASVDKGYHRRAARYASLAEAQADGWEDHKTAWPALQQYFSNPNRMPVLMGTVDRVDGGTNSLSETLGAANRVTAAVAAVPTEPETLPAALTEIAYIDSNFWAVCMTDEFTHDFRTINKAGIGANVIRADSGTETQEDIEDDDIIAAAAWCAANRRHLFAQESADAAASTTATADAAATGTLAARLNGKSGVSVMFGSRKRQGVALEYGSVFANVNYNRPGSAVDGMFLTLAGVDAAVLNTTQMANLEAKNANYYAVRGPYSMTATGVTCDGLWLDDVHFAEWLRYSIQRTLIGYRIQSGRLFQTDADLSAIKTVITLVCERGVDTGAIGPGPWSDVATRQIGNITGSFPTSTGSGYLIWSPPISSLTAAEFSQRKIPPIYVWAHRSGAVHSMDIGLVLTD